MKKNFALIIAGFSAIAILTTSCAKAPQAEIDAAKASVEAAKAAEANRYIADEFNALQDSLNAAMTIVENQNSKFGLFRNYKDAKTRLAAVTAMGDKVKEDAAVRKEEVKAEVQQAMADANTLVQEVKDLMAKAPRGKEGKAALEAIQNDLTLVEASLTEASTLVNNGDYLTAQDKVNAAVDKANGLKSELEEAIAKVRR